jgi:hypothetical protein
MQINVENPTDGQVIEVYPDVWYQFYERQNSWIRLNGYHSIKPATQISAGLMTKEDFIKVNTLLTAPPKTILTSEDCAATFDGGAIRLYSRDHSLFVEDYLDLYEVGDTKREQWHIHEDTWGFNFRVNLQFLVEEMKERGNLIAETLVGSKGLPGDRGEPGIDKLDTGPKGEAGEGGLNAPFAGSIANTSDMILKDKSMAIVNIDTEKVSLDENYLVVYKGTISPENLCTSRVVSENVQSTWVLVRDQQGIVCTQGCGVTPCDDHVVFIDVEVIVDSIKEHANALILHAKQEREEWVREWLQTMMKVFNDQKNALCCALENCRSRKRNQDERRYVESQRISAASADYQLILSAKDDGEDVPEPHTKYDLDMDEYKDCSDTPIIPPIIEPGGDGSGVRIEVHPDPNNLYPGQASHWDLHGVITPCLENFPVAREDFTWTPDSPGSDEGVWILEIDLGSEGLYCNELSGNFTYFAGNLQPDQFKFFLNGELKHDTGILLGAGVIIF